MDSHLRNIKIDSPDQPSRHVTLLGHEPGVILKDELSEYRSMDVAQRVILHRYRTYGLDGLHRLMGLFDDCTLPDFFDGKEYEDRYLGRLLSMERLRPLALEHLGGDESYTVLALNRQAAANYTVMQALVPKGSVVPYVVPPYPGGVRRGHPSIPQAVELARSRWEVVSTVNELERFLDRDPNVPLVTVCPLYRGVVPEETLEAVCSVAQRRDVPVYMDDAAGARMRPLVYGQRRAIEMGADVVSTSCEKAAMHGPRASLIVGKGPLMMRIAAKANVLGTDARPSVVAAIVRALEEYSPEEAKVYYATLAHRHGHLTELLKPIFGDSVSPRRHLRRCLGCARRVPQDRPGADWTGGAEPGARGRLGRHGHADAPRPRLYDGGCSALSRCLQTGPGVHRGPGERSALRRGDRVRGNGLFRPAGRDRFGQGRGGAGAVRGA